MTVATISPFILLLFYYFILLDYYFINQHVQNDVCSCSIEDNSYSYATIKKLCCNFSLKFLQQYLLVWSRSFKDIPYEGQLTTTVFFGNDSHLQSISRYVKSALLISQFPWTFFFHHFHLVHETTSSSLSPTRL